MEFFPGLSELTKPPSEEELKAATQDKARDADAVHDHIVQARLKANGVTPVATRIAERIIRTVHNPSVEDALAAGVKEGKLLRTPDADKSNQVTPPVWKWIDKE